MLFLITQFQFIYSQQETRFNVSIDYSEFIAGSEEMMRSMDRFHVSTEEVFESLATSSVKLDATLSGSLESQVRQLENYKGVVRSVEAAISGSGEQIEEAYMDIARTAQEAARTGATRLIFDVEGAKVQVDLYKKVIDDFLSIISRLSVGVKSGSVTTKEAARGLFEFREAWQDILPSEFIDQLNRTRMSLVATTKDTDGAAKRISELGSAMKQVTAKDVTFRFKVMPEGLEGLAQTQEAIKGVVKESEEVDNIKPVLSGLRNQIDNLPPALSGVAQGFEQVATTGKKLTDMQDAGKLLLVLMEDLKTRGVGSFEAISSALSQVRTSSNLAAPALQPLRDSLRNIQEEFAREANIREFGEALVSAARQPSASMTDLEGNVKSVLDSFKDWERIEGVTDDVASLLSELGKTESIQKARQDILSFGRTLTEGAGTEEYIEKLSEIGESLTATGEDTSKFTSILDKFANANIKTAGDADKLNSEIRRTANNLSTMGEETKAAQSIDKLSESITKSKVDKFGKDITKLTDNLSLTSNSLVDFKDNLLKVGNRYEGMVPSIGNINNLIGDFDEIIKDLIGAGLPQLAGRFKGIREEATKRLGLAYVSEELEKVNSLLKTGDLEDAELSIRDLSSATQLSGNQFKDLRTNLNQLSDSMEKHNVLVQAASKVKQIISNKSISSVGDMREELKKARSEFENTKGLEEFNESLGDVIETSEEFKKIEHFRKALHGLTTIETDDIDLIQASIKGLGDEAEKDARSIEDLVEDLRKLGVSPSGLKSMEKAEESLRGIHGTARKKRVVDQYAKSVGKTADKLDKASTGAKKFTKELGGINKNAGGMRKIFSAMDAQMSRLLIRFGVYGVVKGLVQGVTRAVASLSRGIYTLTKEAAKLQDVSTAFRVLASQTTSAELALAQVRSAAGGVIDEFELMASATRAAIAGLPVERIDDFMRGARALGPLVGRDIPEAFDRLTSAAIKQERRLLDELGIVIRANDAYKEYARTHDTTIDAMKATEKQMAFMDAIMASVNEKILRLGGNLDQAQRPFLRFESAWKDLRISMGDWLSNALDIPGFLNETTRLMKAFSFSLADAAKQSAILAASTLEAFESFKKYSKEFLGSVPKLVEEAELQIKITDDQTKSVAAQYDAQNRLAEITKTLSTVFPILAEILDKDVSRGLRLVTKEAKTLNEVYKSLMVIRIAETFEASAEAYFKAQKEARKYREELDRLKEFRTILLEGSKEEKAVLVAEIKELQNMDWFVAKLKGEIGDLTHQQFDQIIATEVSIRTLEGNVGAISRVSQAYRQQSMKLQELEGNLGAVIEASIATGKATKDEWKTIVDVADAFENYSKTGKDAALDTFLYGTETVRLALWLGIATEDQEKMEAAVAETIKTFEKMVALTGQSNEKIIESIDLHRKLIDKFEEVPKATAKWGEIYKQFETLTKTYNKFRTQFEPTEFMIDIKPSERSKIELKRMETEYGALFDLLAKGIEITAVPAGEVNKTAVAQQMLNELLEDQQRYIQQLVDGEKDLAKETLKSIDKRLEAYKLDKTQVDELNILSNKQLEIRKQQSSINKKLATERAAQTEEAIAGIKRETKNQISAYKQIISKREALVSSLKSLGILSYEQEASLLKKIAQDRITLQKAEWNDEQKRLKDKVKSQKLFADTMLGIMSNVVGANKEAVIDMLGEVSALGIEAFKLDIKPGEIAPEKIMEAFEKIEDIPGLVGIGDETIDISKMVVATLSDMLKDAGDSSSQISEETISNIEDVMREYLISLHANLTEMSAIDSAYLADKQAIEKVLIKLAQNRAKREMGYEKARVNFLKKANKDILNIEKSSNKESIASRVEALKIDFNLLDDEVKKNTDVQQVIQDHAIAAHNKTSDINLENTREYLQKIRRATKTAQLLKIKDEYSIEELGEINKLRLRGEYADKFNELLDKEIDVIENNIKKRQGLEEAAAINRINVARKETRQKIEELIKVAEAEGKPEEVKRLQELSIASQEIASNKITGIIKEASRKRRMESLKSRKGIAGDEEELARLTIDAQMDSYIESNRLLDDVAEIQKQKHLEDISRLLEATDVNGEELAKRSASLQEVLTLEAVTKDNLANADILREQLIAEAIRKIREKEFDEYQAIMKSTADVLGETSKIAFEINKNLIVANAAEREKDLEHAKNIAVRKMQRETEILEEQLQKELVIEADFEQKRRALKTATDDELLQITRDYNSAVIESYLETFNLIIDAAKAFGDMMIDEDTTDYEARKDLQITFWRDQVKSNRKNSDKVLELNQKLADDLLEIDKQSSKDRKKEFNKYLDVVSTGAITVAAIYAGDWKTAIASGIGFISSLGNLFGDAQESAEQMRKEAQQKADDAFRQLKTDWRSAGADLGRSVADAITDNLDVDWDVLVRGFMKAALAAQMGQAFAESFGPSLDMIKDAFAVAIGKGERWDKLVEDETKRIDADVNNLERTLGPLSRFSEARRELIAEGYGVDIVSEMEKGVPTRIIAADVVKAKHGFQNVAKGMDDLNTTFTEMEPEMRGVAASVNAISGIFEEAAEDAGLRALRAITEPQANQIIILLGRQVDHLAMISSNTTTLVKGLGKKKEALPQPIELPAPKINNDMIPDQIQLAPTFNIESPPLPDIINKVEVPEIPSINLTPQITSEVLFEPEIEPTVSFNPNIINKVDIPEISVSPHIINEVDISEVSVSPRIINEVDIPEVSIIVPMAKEIGLSQRTIDQIAPAITAPQIQYIERLAQPVIQRQPKYYPREEVTRSVLSEHTEEIKISININDRTAISEDGMLVDAVLPMLMEEESRMKMRREKASGRRVYNRGRV